MVDLSYTNPLYDNIGMLYQNDSKHNTRKDSDFRFLSSAVYIGNGICLTCAHVQDGGLFYFENQHYAIRFEINGKKTPLYHVAEFKTHPHYEKNSFFDIAALILEKPVDGLNGLNVCSSFSEKNQIYPDYQHLLTYVHYGQKLFGYDWFCVTDNKRRAMQAYTQSCILSSMPGIYSTPYCNSNDYKNPRLPILYEAKGRDEMSGGAVIHPDFGLVSVIEGTIRNKDKEKFTTSVYLFFSEIIDTFLYPINYFLFTVPFLNRSINNNFTRIYSLPLSVPSVKSWLEDIRLEKIL